MVWIKYLRPTLISHLILQSFLWIKLLVLYLIKSNISAVKKPLIELISTDLTLTVKSKIKIYVILKRISCRSSGVEMGWWLFWNHLTFCRIVLATWPGWLFLKYKKGLQNYLKALFCWPTRIRTLTYSTKNCSATVTPSINFAGCGGKDNEALNICKNFF